MLRAGRGRPRLVVVRNAAFGPSNDTKGGELRHTGKRGVARKLPHKHTHAHAHAACFLCVCVQLTVLRAGPVTGRHEKSGSLFFFKRSEGRADRESRDDATPLRLALSPAAAEPALPPARPPSTHAQHSPTTTALPATPRLALSSLFVRSMQAAGGARAVGVAAGLPGGAPVPGHRPARALWTAATRPLTRRAGGLAVEPRLGSTFGHHAASITAGATKNGSAGANAGAGSAGGGKKGKKKEDGESLRGMRA